MQDELNYHILFRTPEHDVWRMWNMYSTYLDAMREFGILTHNGEFKLVNVHRPDVTLARRFGPRWR